MRILLLTLCCLYLPASYGMSWGELRAEIESVESGNSGDVVIIQRMSEIVQTIVSYRAAIIEAGSTIRLFCPEAEREMHLNDFVSMVRREAQLQRAGDEASVQDLLISGLASNYSCAE